MTEKRHEWTRIHGGSASGGQLSQEEHERIDRYLAGRLSDEEAADVETRIIHDAEFRAEVELTESLREGLQELASRGELEPVLGVSTPFWQRPVYALAATVVATFAGITAIALYQQLDQARDRISVLAQNAATTRLAGSGATEVLQLVRARGAGSEPDVLWQTDPGIAQIELRLDAGVEPAAAYALQIARLDGNTPIKLLALPSVVPADGEVVVTVNAAWLGRGDYAVTIAPVDGGEETVFRLRID